MANKQLFSSSRTQVPVATAKNRAGGNAFQLTDAHALAQYACTGTFSNTYYASDKMQVDEVLALAQKVPADFLAKVAVYSRTYGFMKDMPAFLLAVLSIRDIELFKKAFPKVIDNGKMLRNFVQIMRSGVVGRKSLGTAPKRMVEQWLESRTDEQLFKDTVGNDPSMADVVAMVHPHGATKSRQALYGYMLGRNKHSAEELPQIVKDFEAFKATVPGTREVPNLPFEMLTGLPLSNQEWTKIAENARWHMTRMNLNTFARHGVFSDKAVTKMIIDRLKSEKEIKGAKVFPYQLLTAFQNADANEVPQPVINALQDAMEVATSNVPSFYGKVYVAVDVSGSMGSAVTGYRTGQPSSKTSCRDVAALIASCVLRKADDAQVYTFDTTCRQASLNARDSIMTNASKISCPGGGTDCAVVLKTLNAKQAMGDTVILVSDMESWAGHYGRSTGVQEAWKKYKARNTKAKLVCIDLQAHNTTQAVSSTDTLNIGGFSDQVFNVIAGFVQGGNAQYWTDKINAEVSL